MDLFCLMNERNQDGYQQVKCDTNTFNQACNVSPSGVRDGQKITLFICLFIDF